MRNDELFWDFFKNKILYSGFRKYSGPFIYYYVIMAMSDTEEKSIIGNNQK